VVVFAALTAQIAQKLGQIRLERAGS